MAARAVAGTVVLLSTAALAFAGWITSLPHAERLGDNAYFVGVLGGVSLEWELTGLVLIWLRPGNALGWLFLATGASSVCQIGFNGYGVYGAAVARPPWPGAYTIAAANTGLWIPPVIAPSTILVAYYPGGQLAARWWRWPVAGVATALVLAVIVLPFYPAVFTDSAPGLQAPPALPSVVLEILLLGICVPVLALSTVAIWAGTVARLIRAKPPERQQLAWFVCIAGPLMAATYIDVPRPALAVCVYLVPVVVAVGVLRYRLLGIETVLRRSVVYGSLTGVVMAMYLAVTALAGSALDQSPLPGVMAAALVAVVLTPARARLQLAADRLVYGARRDPLGALARLGDQVAVAGEPDLLPAALHAVADAVRAPGATVTAPDGRVLGSWGTAPSIGHTVALQVGGRDVGALQVAHRDPADTYAEADVRLLAAMAAQVAVLVRALELTELLEAQRDRVVAATQAERARLRHDLHDGLGPSLSGMALGLQAASHALATGDTAGCDPLLDRIRDEVATCVAEIRRIIDGLRPTILDSLKLDEAIHRHAASLSPTLPVDVSVAALPPLPPDVETAAYRIVTEALTNTVRHACARRCQISLATRGPLLRIVVSDDGAGIPHGTTTGVGLASMHRRAQALGGTFTIDTAPHGTTVTVTLPLEEP
ncbi:sensor histidine kinase [Streptomyces sp. NPDC005209]|uniref:sensor histidine kinase n=1 Tax=Streptomyces sp. NPDC005209 TaxID=3156715 RepID=UPI0033BC00CA